MGTIWGNRKADRVAEDLLRQVVSGVVKVGELLPKEAELAERYQVNRSVIREAVKQLEAHRLVEPIRRRGTVVLDPLSSSSPDVVRAMIEPSPGRYDESAMAEMLEVRATLDVEMTGLAAQRRDADDLAAMHAILEELRDALGDHQRYAALMEEMALATARATKNRLYQMLVHWHKRMRAADADPLRLLMRTATDTHLAGVRHIVGLVEASDAERARAFVRAVHEWATPRVLDVVKSVNRDEASYPEPSDFLANNLPREI
jgi:DNA-binding FadR family transcriptional regulator